MKLNKIGFGENTFAPTIRTAFMDTGSTLILMPMEDWVSLYNMICADIPYGSTCYTTDYYYVLRGYRENRKKFGPILFQIDNTIYSVPFYRLFNAYTDDTLVLNINTKKNGLILGTQFLDSFYQVFDLQRN